MCNLNWPVLLFLLFTLFETNAYAQQLREAPSRDAVRRIDPPSWWVGMAESQVELMVYGDQIGRATVSLSYPGVRIVGVAPAQNPDYLFIQLEIDRTARAGEIGLTFKLADGREVLHRYLLQARERSLDRHLGVTSEDFIYLLMPDRFANGDPGNDVKMAMRQEIKPGEKYQRRGGDIRGIIDRLDYLQDLGVTTLWLNPVLENDQPHESYHGYAATDHYRVDARLGTNQDYKALVDEAHRRGMKVLMDVIHNHVGDQHWFIRDMPSQDWVHQWDTGFTRTTYRATTLMDPYASEYDRKKMSNGWFDVHMPDLNQDNPHVARYLTQNNIWWIEYLGLDGFRIDTYAYPDQRFMSDWGERIQREYPQFTFFGETWVHGVAVQAWFTQGTGMNPRFDSNLPAVTDFQLYYAINDMLTQDFGWTQGMMRPYYVLAQDFIYSDPYANVVFLDNHDLARFFSVIDEDINRYKMGVAFMLTTRGIPCMYYGTEVLMRNNWNPENHDDVRLPFPGGFDDGQENKFEASGRSKSEQDAFDFVRSLARYRRATPALQYGNLTQFVPENGVYTFFRHDDETAVMVILNQNVESQPVDMLRFREVTRGVDTGRDVLTGQPVQLKNFQIAGRGVRVIELSRR